LPCDVLIGAPTESQAGAPSSSNRPDSVEEILRFDVAGGRFAVVGGIITVEIHTAEMPPAVRCKLLGEQFDACPVLRNVISAVKIALISEA